MRWVFVAVTALSLLWGGPAFAADAPPTATPPTSNTAAPATAPAKVKKPDKPKPATAKPVDPAKSTDKPKTADKPKAADKPKTADKPKPADKPKTADKPPKPDQPKRADKPDKPKQAAKPDKPTPPDKAKPVVEKSEKPKPVVEKPPPDPCAVKTNCKFSPPMDAGKDENGGQLTVLAVRIFDAADRDGKPCRDDAGPNEYILLRGDPAKPTARQIIMRQCVSAPDIDDPSIAIQPNMVSISHFEPGTTVQHSFTRVYSLSPPRLTNRDECDITTTAVPNFREISVDMASLNGEGSALVQITEAEHKRLRAEYGCQEKKAKFHWLVLPRVTVDAGALKSASAALGTCAAVMKPDGAHGYVLAGAADANDKVEIKLLATGARTLIVQLIDPDHHVGDPDRLEIWMAEGSKLALDAESDKKIAQFTLDIDSGKIAGAGAKVTRWTAKAASGADAALFQIVLPGAPGSQPAVTIAYNQGGGKTPKRVLATSLLLRARASSLGEMYDFSAYTKCAIKNGALDIAEWGKIKMPLTIDEPP